MLRVPPGHFYLPATKGRKIAKAVPINAFPKKPLLKSHQSRVSQADANFARNNRAKLLARAKRNIVLEPGEILPENENEILRRYRKQEDEKEFRKHTAAQVMRHRTIQRKRAAIQRQEQNEATNERARRDLAAIEARIRQGRPNESEPSQQERVQRRRRRRVINHGNHHTTLDDINEYLKFYLTNTFARGHKKSGKFLEKLLRHYNDRKIYSLHTKKWRRYKPQQSSN